MEKRDENMIRIGICDDENSWIEKIEKTIKECQKQYGYPLEIHTFSAGEELLNCQEHFDLLFLDVEMPQMDGLETAKQFRLVSVDTEIAYLTTHQEIMKEAFQVRAFRFLDKADWQSEILSCMQAFFREWQEKEQIEVMTSSGVAKVRYCDIQWIEAEHSGTIVFGAKNEIRCTWPLQKWEEALEKRSFFRCHKKYMVNLQWIDKIDKILYLKSGCQLEVSRRKKAELEEAYVNYMFQAMRG